MTTRQSPGRRAPLTSMDHKSELQVGISHQHEHGTSVAHVAPVASRHAHVLPCQICLRSFGDVNSQDLQLLSPWCSSQVDVAQWLSHALRETSRNGGAEGVDAIFDAAMAQLTFGQCIHWSFEGHDFRARPEGRVNLPEDIARLCDPYLHVAAGSLGQSVPRKPHVLALFRRNVLQALWADAMIAVIWEDLEASYPLRMGGGTKWAAQVYVDRFQPIGVEAAESCHLYLYEVNSAVWKRWDCLAQAWTPASPPILSRTMSFAGIGTRTPPQHAIDAIHSLFKDLSGHLSDSAPDPHLDEPKESNCSGESHGPSALHVPSALCASGRRWRRRD
ncbi:Hypothetical protein SCF082_LOCUS43643 [Durusdinium trenchii]